MRRCLADDCPITSAMLPRHATGRGGSPPVGAAIEQPYCLIQEQDLYGTCRHPSFGTFSRPRRPCGPCPAEAVRLDLLCNDGPITLWTMEWPD